MARLDPANPPLWAYSPDDITDMLDDSRANLPEDDPWRRQLGAFEAEEARLGAQLVEQTD